MVERRDVDLGSHRRGGSGSVSPHYWQTVQEIIARFRPVYEVTTTKKET